MRVGGFCDRLVFSPGKETQDIVILWQGTHFRDKPNEMDVIREEDE